MTVKNYAAAWSAAIVAMLLGGCGGEGGGDGQTRAGVLNEFDPSITAMMVNLPNDQTAFYVGPTPAQPNTPLDTAAQGVTRFGTITLGPARNATYNARWVGAREFGFCVQNGSTVDAPPQVMVNGQAIQISTACNAQGQPVSAQAAQLMNAAPTMP